MSPTASCLFNEEGGGGERATDMPRNAGQKTEGIAKRTHVHRVEGERRKFSAI